MIRKTAVIAFLTPIIMFGSVISGVATADEAMIEKGKEVAFDRKQGNCLANGLCV